MKNFLLLLLAVSLFSFITTKKNIIASKVTVPPGTVMLREGLYIDKFEISNAMWREFTHGWLLGVEDDTASFNKMAPDSTVWYSLKIDRDRFIYNYHVASQFGNFPAVGISYEQAVAFCEWRTDRVNEMIDKNPGNFSFRKVTYRLPTEGEWELAAAGKLDTARYPYGSMETKILTKEDSLKMFNCVYADLDSIHNTIQPLPVSIDYGKANGYGIYNIIGNVAEMVSEKGLAKGGFYELPLEYCKIRERSGYNTPNRYLGFRCICTTNSGFGIKPDKDALKNEKPAKTESKKDRSKKKTQGFEVDQ